MTVDTADLLSLELDLDGLTHRVTDLESEHRNIAEQCQDADAQMTDHAEQLDALQAELDGVRSDVGGVGRRVTRTRQHLAWLEHHLLAGTTPQPVDLDHVDDLTQDLLARIDSGAKAQRHLTRILRGRSTAEATLAEHERLVRLHREQTTEANAQADTILASPAGSPQRGKADHTFQQARHAAARAKEQLTAMHDKIVSAQRTVNRACAAETQLRPIIDTGAHALRQLTGRLKHEVSKAVDEHRQMPPWLVNTHGHTPLPGHRAEWIDLVVDVLMYRLRHNITTPDRALTGGTSRDSTERDQLAHRLTTFDEAVSAPCGDQDEDMT